jgi:hypothetical protein
VLQRIILPGNPFIFTHLRHLKLELVLYGKKKRKTDVLDYAYLLEVAPFIEKLELLVSLSATFRKHISHMNRFYATCWEIVNARNMLLFDFEFNIYVVLPFYAYIAPKLLVH